MKKRSFVLADFIYGISLMIVAIIVAIFIGNLTIKFKENLENSNIIKELSEYGVIQFIYPPKNYILNKKIFELKLFSIKDVKIKYKVFFISEKDVNFCSQDLYYLRKGLNIIPLDLTNCINESQGIIRFSILYQDNVVNTYDIKYNNKSSNIEIYNMPLRNYVLVGSEIFEGIPNLYYTVPSKNIYIELVSPYYFYPKLLNLEKGEIKKINVSSFIYNNVTFKLTTYTEGIYSIYVNNYYIGSITVGQDLKWKYKDDFLVKSFDIYQGTDKILHLENTELTVNNNEYPIKIKLFDICLKDAHNNSIALPGFVFVRNSKSLFYTDHGKHDSCVTVPVAFTPDLQEQILVAYTLDKQKYGTKSVTESSPSNQVIYLSD